MMVRQGNRPPASPDHLHDVLTTRRPRPAVALEEMQRPALVEQLCHVTTLKPIAAVTLDCMRFDTYCAQLPDTR